MGVFKCQKCNSMNTLVDYKEQQDGIDPFVDCLENHCGGSYLLKWDENPIEWNTGKKDPAIEKTSLVKVSIELMVPQWVADSNGAVGYLNHKLWNDPEYFGDFGEENVSVIQRDIDIVEKIPVEGEIINKLTIGYVIQKVDIKTSKVIRQEFVAGEVEWENEEGESLDENDVPENVYFPYTMEQPSPTPVKVIETTSQKEVDNLLNELYKKD